MQPAVSRSYWRTISQRRVSTIVRSCTCSRRRAKHSRGRPIAGVVGHAVDTAFAGRRHLRARRTERRVAHRLGGVSHATGRRRWCGSGVGGAARVVVITTARGRGECECDNQSGGQALMGSAEHWVVPPVGDGVGDQLTRTTTECHPVAPSGMGATRSSGWTFPSASVARTSSV